MNIQFCIDEFITYISGSLGRSDHTVESYALDLRQFADYLEVSGVDAAEEISMPLLRGFLREISGLGLTKTSVARKLSALRGFVKYLASRRVLASDVSVGLKGPKLEQGIPRALAYEDVIKILTEGTADSKKRARDRLLLELLYSSGLRVSEVVSLNWQDVDIDERWIRVMGKGSKERIVPFGREAQDQLRSWRASLEIAGVPVDGDAPLFAGVGADRLTERTVHRVVVAAGKKVGIFGVHPHSLRHSFATHMLERGAPLAVIQELLGHESLVTTQRYLTITAEQMRASYMRAHPHSGYEVD